MRQTPAWLTRVGVGVLAINALDVTTSLIPSPADHLVPVPVRSQLAWWVQLALLLPLLILAARRLPVLVHAYRELPVPPLPRAVLAGFFAIAMVHVALRLKRYPWSPVAMFSSAVPIADTPAVTRMGYVIVRDTELEAVSFLREGSPWFARHGLGFDYKAGWAMHLYAPSTGRARDVLFERVAEEGLPEPVRTRVTYSRGDGRLLLRVRPQ